MLSQLLWVKENLQESWSMVFRWMDLSDWLSYRCTVDFPPLGFDTIILHYMGTYPHSLF